MLKKHISVLLSIALLFLFYPIKSVAENIETDALHTDNFLVKENMESYSKYNSITDTWVSKSGAVNVSLESEGKSYGNSGQSLKCIYDFSQIDSHTLSFYSNKSIYNEDMYGNPLGESSRFGFWISTDKDIKLQVRVVDSSSDWQNYSLTTEYLNIPAGNSFVELDWLDFIASNSNVYHKYYNLLQTQFIITKTATNQTGTVYIDEIGIIPTESAVRTHGSGFEEAMLDCTKWTSKNEFVDIFGESSARFCSNSNDEISLAVGYEELSVNGIPDFYYNGNISIKSTEPYIYGEKSVFSFWTYSTQDVKLNVSYKDTNINGALVQCKAVTVDIPKGQHITTLKMSDFAPENDNMIYKGVYQLEFMILPKSNSINNGTLYIDAFGFYDSDTEKEFSTKLKDLDSVSIENTSKVYEVMNYVNSLSSNCFDDITDYTYSRYEKIIAEYDLLTPYIAEVASETESEYERGSLSFLTVYDKEPENWTILELGGLVHREGLLENSSLLALDTKKVLSAGAIPFKSPQGYLNKIKLKSSSSVSEANGSYVGDGFYNTAYLIRPYAILRNKTTLKEIVVYGRIVNTAKSSDIAENQMNIARAFDADENTAWMSTEGTHKIDYVFDNPKTFNAIKLLECRNTATEYTISDFCVEITDETGKRVKIYTQDEMGQRIGFMDKTYTAKSVHLTVTAIGNVGIKNIEFISIKSEYKHMIHSSYFTATGFDSTEIYQRYPAVNTLTDVILFDLGSWTIDGSFNYSQGDNEYYGETQLSNVVTNLRKSSECPNIWFCIKNYDKEQIKQIALAEGISTTEAKNRLLSTSQARKKLIDYCVYICDKYNLYGIDVDYEYPENKQQWGNFDLFIKELSVALKDKGYKLSLALSSFNINYLSDEAVSVIDIVNMMTYDSVNSDGHGRHNGYNGSLAQINYFLNIGFKPQQLVLGFGFYGKKSDNMEYYNYSELLRRYPESFSFDRNWYGEYYCAGVTSIVDKTLLAYQMNLAGVFSFTVKSDVDYSNKFSLTNAINSSIQRLTQ